MDKSAAHREGTRGTLLFSIEALSVGGAEQMLVAMANNFAGRGFEVHMLCLSSAGELASSLHSDIQLHVLDKAPGFDRRLPGKIRKLVRRVKPMAVNSHLWTANLWTRLALVGTGIPVVITEHSRDTWKPAHYRWLDRLLVKFTRKLVAVSNDTARFYIDEIGIPESLVTVINNGIDSKKYASGDGQHLRDQWAPQGQLLVGTIGRMVSAKNHLRLVDVAARLAPDNPGIRFVIVGDGEERKVIEQAVDTHNLQDTVLLVGARSDIADVLAALDIFILTSDREGHPLTALEAQAAGTPVVLTNAGGSADALAIDGNKRGGYVVDKDCMAVADAISTLAEDESMRADMASFAQQHALLHFDQQQMIDRYQALFIA